MNTSGIRLSRREAVAAIAAALAGLLGPGTAAWARPPVTHPEPRAGITGASVLDPASVPGRARGGYEAAREIPEILDGLYCHCDCAERDGLRSLLSCFETRMPMPVSCGICVGEARLALRLRREGRSLREIRRAVDERYG
jgi:hypothetical protein